MRWIGLAAGGWVAGLLSRVLVRWPGRDCRRRVLFVVGAFTARATAVWLLMASPCAQSRATAGSLRWRAEAR